MIATLTSFDGSVFIDEGVNRHGTLFIGQDEDLKNFQPPTTEPKDLAWHFKYQPDTNTAQDNRSVISISTKARMFASAKSIRITVDGVSAVFSYSAINSNNFHACFLATGDVFNLSSKKGQIVKFKVEII